MRHGFFLNTTQHNYDSVIPQMAKAAKSIADMSLDYECYDFGHIDFRLDDKDGASFKFGRNRERFQMRPYAVYQLCQRLGIPYSYYQKLVCIPELRGLAYDSINTLAKHSKENVVLRTCGEDLRGIVSSKYCCFDADQLLDVFQKAFNVSKILPRDEVWIRGHYLDMEISHLRFTNADAVKGLNDKDLYFGMQMTSSDVGRSSIRLRFFVYKQICTNGLCIGEFDQELYYQRHINVTKDEVYQKLMNAFLNYPYLVVQAKEMLNMAGTRSLKKSKLLMVQELGKVDKKVEIMQKYLGVSQTDMLTLAELTREKYEPSVWGYVNAITEFAQKFNVARRIELEAKAGKLLTNKEIFDVA